MEKRDQERSQRTKYGETVNKQKQRNRAGIEKRVAR
jgi:hypothetical protein